MRALRDQVVRASVGRDRVLDAIKALSLLVVIVGHSLAWHVRPDGTPVNVLEDARYLIVLTWVFQVLPLFFAAGAVSNAGSLQRHGREGYLQARGTRLLAPVVVYATVWTLILLPIQAVGAGRFLAQLLWFAGVYLLVAAAAVVTTRWIPRPALSLGLWLLLILAVDLLRLTDLAGLAWLNMLLAWGWLHQVGYYLPQLRRRRAAIPAGLLLIAASVVVAFAGPYSVSLISVNGVPGLSNLAPPSVVLVLFGAGQILIVAGLWPLLTRWLQHDRLWVPIALVGARGMGMYLWHIPLVGLAAGTAILLGFHAAALSPAWWAIHLLVVVVVIPLAWLIAGLAAVPERWLLVLPGINRAGVGCALGGLAVLNTAATGFGTWWGGGAAGIPSSAAVNIALVVLAYALVMPARAHSAPSGKPQRSGRPAPR
jgi:fucose 4-O-acetylase-like acetyltransferase